jgi:adenosylcobinamide kinase/adenosylcobinamide-phosphate guanylyltransferase
MLTLILGGARSGKSDLAQRLAAAGGGDVVFIATMEAGDDELRAKVAAHRTQRPATWRTIEEPIAVEDAVATCAPGSTVVVDCLTMWVTNLLLARTDADRDTVTDATTAIDAVAARAARLARAASAHDGDLIVVSNEVGLGLVPPYPLGRAFRDALGSANRIFAAEAGRVYFTVAGLALDVRAMGALPVTSFGAKAR